jgi:hypothetical protein
MSFYGLPVRPMPRKDANALYFQALMNLAQRRAEDESVSESVRQDARETAETYRKWMEEML